MTKVVEIALFTDDVEAATRFYSGLFGAPPAEEWPGGAIFAAGDVKLLVHGRTAVEPGGPPNEDHFAVGIANLEEAYDELSAAGASLIVEPRDYPWGRSAYLRDPDGRLIELAQS